MERTQDCTHSDPTWADVRVFTHAAICVQLRPCVFRAAKKSSCSCLVHRPFCNPSLFRFNFPVVFICRINRASFDVGKRGSFFELLRRLRFDLGFVLIWPSDNAVIISLRSSPKTNRSCCRSPYRSVLRRISCLGEGAHRRWAGGKCKAPLL